MHSRIGSTVITHIEAATMQSHFDVSPPYRSNVIERAVFKTLVTCDIPVYWLVHKLYGLS